jgi:hypothetical protein
VTAILLGGVEHFAEVVPEPLPVVHVPDGVPLEDGDDVLVGGRKDLLKCPFGVSVR